VSLATDFPLPRKPDSMALDFIRVTCFPQRPALAAIQSPGQDNDSTTKSSMVNRQSSIRRRALWGALGP
jgi:hypothetical protein